MAKEKKINGDELNVKARISPELARQFKLARADRGGSIQDILVAAIKAYVAGSDPQPPVAKGPFDGLSKRDTETLIRLKDMLLGDQRRLLEDLVKMKKG